MLLLSLQNSHNSYETVIKDSNLNPDKPTWSKTLTPTVVNLPKVSSKPTLTIDNDRYSHGKNPLPRIRIANHSSKLVTAECANMSYEGIQLSRWGFKEPSSTLQL